MARITPPESARSVIRSLEINFEEECGENGGQRRKNCCYIGRYTSLCQTRPEKFIGTKTIELVRTIVFNSSTMRCNHSESCSRPPSCHALKTEGFLSSSGGVPCLSRRRRSPSHSDIIDQLRNLITTKFPLTRPPPGTIYSARIAKIAPPRPVFESVFAQRADLVSGRIERCW